MFKWLTSERSKSIATILSAIGSLVAVTITALKPSGNSQSAQAYELLRVEVEQQREELYTLHKSLIEVDTWFRVWREFEAARKREMEEMQLRSRAMGKNVKPDPLIELQEVPPPPPVVPQPPASRSTLPPAKKIF